MLKPRLISGHVKEHHTPEAGYVLNVYGVNGELIMWCGPMTRVERSNLIDIFRKAGWTTAGRD